MHLRRLQFAPPTCMRMSTGGGGKGPTEMQWEEPLTALAMVDAAPFAKLYAQRWPVVPQPGGPGAVV